MPQYSYRDGTLQPMLSNDAKAARVLTWLQVAGIVVAVALGVVHIDRRITRLEDRVEEEIRSHQALERRLDKLEQLHR